MRFGKATDLGRAVDPLVEHAVAVALGDGCFAHERIANDENLSLGAYLDFRSRRILIV